MINFYPRPLNVNRTYVSQQNHFDLNETTISRQQPKQLLLYRQEYQVIYSRRNVHPCGVFFGNLTLTKSMSKLTPFNVILIILLTLLNSITVQRMHAFTSFLPLTTIQPCNDVSYSLYASDSRPLLPQPPKRDLLISSPTRMVYPFAGYRDLLSTINFSSTVMVRRSTTKARTTRLFMGKGDGKKKRPKKAEDGGGVESSKSSVPDSKPIQPLRISSNLNIPVRQQLAIAQMNKLIRQQQQDTTSASSSSSGSSGKVSPLALASKPRVRTAYRRTWEEEEVIQKAEERKRRGQEPDWDVILNRTAVSPLLIVDGYNIIHAWPRLKKHMTKGDPSRARQLLIDDLENLQSIKGWRIECVFDGTRRSTIGPLGDGPGSNSNSIAGTVNPLTRGLDQVTKKTVSKYGVRVVFSGLGMEADTYIEGRCLRAKNVTNGEITGSLIVATDDAMIRVCGQNAGAVCMSSSRFVDELKAVQKAVAYRVEAAVAKVNGHAIRPEQLRGTSMPTRFGRRSVVIEDKRNRTKINKKNEMIDQEYELYISSVIQHQAEEDDNGIPWWAKVPDQSK